ncbi:DENN domain and WD repeat-containing protein SCD1 isoform X2 [Nymphaea colorata]|uniref:DENN domain and WD repeat-containing protein SCD1 isoform X2 n=1 Tax=Nymphaea colorata TaxID=210225 RepID=UPI00129ED004|nr:DENN domain and WD repeat-containing protein SCD1 isoform X2 [Nymphaea colorata]
MVSGGRIFEYFVVCGIGPEIRSLDGNKGYQGMGVMYMPSFLDQFPHSKESTYPPPPPQLPTCVLPAGVEFYSSGPNSKDLSTFPRSYPIVLTEGDGSKIYVSCIAFRDPVSEDIAEAYRIPPNSYADKCICLVSRSPSFHVLREALEELFNLCFSSAGSSKPLWDVVAHMVLNVPLPTPGKDRVLFAVENCLLCIEVPPKDGLPHADISFQPLVQCLDVDNFIRFFTAVLLEKRILIRANTYSLLTLVSEAICHLIYPFRWQHVYIPLLFFSGVDYIDAPTPYMMGLHSGVDTSGLAMDGVVVIDLDYNRISTTEEIPSIPEPELSFLRGEIMKLLYPNVIEIDLMKGNGEGTFGRSLRGVNKPWSKDHDLQLRLIFLRFLATILSGYRNFLENTAVNVFNSQAFLKKRSRMTNLPPDPMLMQFLDSQGFLDFLERCTHSDENSNNLLDKLQDAVGRGQNPSSVLPMISAELETLTIADPVVGVGGSGARYCYDRFPANVRTEEQEERRKAILAAASGALEYQSRHTPSSPSVSSAITESLSPRERAAERERMVLDIQVKLQGLWLRLLKLGATDDPLSSFEYGTILALIESDAEGIGGRGFVECIREHIHSGWVCRLTDEQFVAVKELLKTAIGRATSRTDMATVRDALEVSAEMYRKDSSNMPDYVQRHLSSISTWDELRFWEGYFDSLMERSSDKSGNYATLVTAQLAIIASHMAGLGLSDTDSWFMLETLAEKNNIGYKQFIKLRGLLSHIQQLRYGYWGPSPGKVQAVSSYGVPSPGSQDVTDESQQPAEASGVGRSWVHSMFSREASTRSSSFSRGRKWTSDNGSLAENSKSSVSSGKTEPATAQKKIQSSVRILRGHKGAVTALHCVTRRDVWDLVGDREDAGFFISGSTDCLVKIWDPSLRGSELKATLQGHTKTVRALSSDRAKVVSGSDDQSVIVWDKQTYQLLEELKGHEAQVSCVKMLSGERVLTASHDGSVKMWDVRTDTCVATVGRCSSAVLCMEYDDSTGMLAAGGRDPVANVWDIRAGRQMHKLVGHTKWIRSLRMVGDTVITGSDDWTARMWSVSRGTCDAVLACHAGPILCVEYTPSDKGIITGSTDGLLRFWENEEGGIRCVKNVTIHSASILSINAGEHWLGIAAADNSMSLFHRPQERFGSFSSPGSKMAGWQLYRTPQRTVAMVRCAASDLDRKRICSGGRNGLLRLWEATINI